MPTATGDSLDASLAELGVAVRRTDPAEFASTIDAAVTEPAVGVPLPWDDLSLADTVVETPPTPELLHSAETGVTPASKAIAEYGTVVLDSDRTGSEPVSLYPPHHVAVVRERDVLPDVGAATDHLRNQFLDGGSAVLATGASSTGDMGAPVEGVHGPKRVTVVLVEGP